MKRRVNVLVTVEVDTEGGVRTGRELVAEGKRVVERHMSNHGNRFLSYSDVGSTRLLGVKVVAR